MTLMSLDPALAQYHAALLWFLDVPSDDPHWAALDPTQRRRRALDGVRVVLVRESARRPVVLVCEDLHWIDTETQTFLDEVVAGLASAHLLLVVTYRPEYSHGWANMPSCTQFRMEALPPDTTDELLETLMGPDPGLRPLKRLLVKLTDRNPFFLEETVRTLSEVGILAGVPGAYRQARKVEALQIPPTVQAILAARIDRLPDGAKRLLQSAAVVGMDVPLVLLQEIVDEGDADLSGHLAILQAGEFLYEARLFPDFEYTFRHVLTHDVAYGSLSQARRRALHARIAGAIERLQPKRLIEDVDRLAHHTFRGEVWDRAVRYSRQAGNKAQQRSANREAVAWLEQALAALAHLPTEPATLGQAIDLRLELRGSLYAIGELERMHAYLREAESLAAELDDPRRRGWVSMHLGEYSRQIGNFREASALIERAHEIASSYRRSSAPAGGGPVPRHGHARAGRLPSRRRARAPGGRVSEGGARAGRIRPHPGGNAGGIPRRLAGLARALSLRGGGVRRGDRARTRGGPPRGGDRSSVHARVRVLGTGLSLRGRGESSPPPISLLDRALTAARGAGLTRLLPQVMRALGVSIRADGARGRRDVPARAGAGARRSPSTCGWPSRTRWCCSARLSSWPGGSTTPWYRPPGRSRWRAGGGSGAMRPGPCTCWATSPPTATAITPGSRSTSAPRPGSPRSSRCARSWPAATSRGPGFYRRTGDPGRAGHERKAAGALFRSDGDALLARARGSRRRRVSR